MDEWVAAWTGAVAGDGVRAALGIETGPGALLTGFAGELHSRFL